MAETKRGAHNTTNVGVHTTTPEVRALGKYNKVYNVSGSGDGVATVFEATASNRGAKAFIVNTAGNSVITTTHGGSLTASNLNAKSVYEMSVLKVSGSGNIDLLY